MIVIIYDGDDCQKSLNRSINMGLRFDYGIEVIHLSKLAEAPLCRKRGGQGPHLSTCKRGLTLCLAQPAGWKCLIKDFGVSSRVRPCAIKDQPPDAHYNPPIRLAKNPITEQVTE